MRTNGGGRTDDRGVSSVIATILMVAIAVTLAAVIGGFVVDLARNNSTDGPDVAISLELDQGENGGFDELDQADGESVVVSHDGGNPVERSDLVVLVNGTPVSDVSTLTLDPGLPEELTAETRVSIVPTGPGTNDLVSGTEIRVNYQGATSNRSYVLAEQTIP